MPRPRGPETRSRTRELLRLVKEGEPLLDAAKAAHVSPERVLRLLGEDAFLSAYLAVRQGDAGPLAAVVCMPSEVRDAPLEAA